MIKTLRQRITSVALAGIIALGCAGAATTTALVSSAANTTPAYADEWKQSSGKWWYQTGSSYAVGWKQINKTWYYFDKSGWMKTGWQSISGKWYYFNKNGAMVTGWNKVDGTWYLHASSGAMLTGWQTVGGKWYYMNTSGAMQTSSWIDGYYYVKADGSMATNTWIYGYYVGPDGRWIPGYSEANNSTPNDQTVYWVANGKRYHSTADCPALGRSTNIQSGSIDQAGNRTPCKDCY